MSEEGEVAAPPLLLEIETQLMKVVYAEILPRTVFTQHVFSTQKPLRTEMVIHNNFYK